MIFAQVNHGRLTAARRLSRRLITQTLTEVTKALHLKEDVEISIAFVSESQMRKLNSRWRGKNRVTDVLSFELDEGEVFGEVLISYEQAARQAKTMKHSTRDEITFLLVHGVLHLFGYDHERPRDAKKMFPLQTKILKHLGVDPRV